MSRAQLTRSERQELVEQDLTGSKDNYIDTHSTGWCDRDTRLLEDEHLPDFPSPQGPNVNDLIQSVERERTSMQDEFDRNYERWGVWPGRRLRF